MTTSENSTTEKTKTPSIENVFVENAVRKEEIMSVSAPYVSEEYFSDISNRIIFEVAKKFYMDHEQIPSKNAMMVELAKVPEMKNDVVSSNIAARLKEIYTSPLTESPGWVLKESEKWCKDRAMAASIYKAYQTLQKPEGEDKTKELAGLPDLLSNALGVSFVPDVGMNYFDGAEERYEYLVTPVVRIKTGLWVIDHLTNGGLKKKTLTVPVAAINMGKTTFCTDLAVKAMRFGHNVLYVTLEECEEDIGIRMDANFADTEFLSLPKLGKEGYINTIRGKRTKGNIEIVEYPASSVTTRTIMTYINELKMKKKFYPDLVIVDSMNLLLSQRFLTKSARRDDLPIKQAAEELKAMSQKMNVAVVSPTQLNFEGIKSPDPEMTDTGDSRVGPAQAADFMFSLTGGEEHERYNRCVFKLLKTRYKKKDTLRYFIGVDRNRARFYDLEDEVSNIQKQQQSASPPPKSNGGSSRHSGFVV